MEALALATETYVYAYPLVTMEMTRRIMTNVAAPKARAPQWVSSSDARIPQC